MKTLQLSNFSLDAFFELSSKSKIDVTHRKLLKFVLGVNKSCPNLALYGETNEEPLLLKKMRLSLNFWHRVTFMPDSYLVKKALLENIKLRTNWLKTIEKLLNGFNLTDKIGNHITFKKKSKQSLENKFREWWESSLGNSNLSRLNFYKTVSLSHVHF